LTEEVKEGAKLEKGAVIRLDYDLYVVSPDGKEELYDTTSEELAKKENMHDEKKVYDSVPLIVGHDRTVKGLDKSLLSAKVGEENTVEIPPADGAGERKPDLVELISMREFARDHKDEEPQIGMEIVRKGKRGLITGISAGRIRIDFNNPLAGKTLKYKYKVVKMAESLEDRIKDVIHLDYGMSDDFVLNASTTPTGHWSSTR
jgi:FKBP-type peptidyl-prolyl cis-trans isomerase 2